jgi:flagellar protein FlgJ
MTEVQALGAQYLNNARFDVKPPTAPKGEGGGVFADMLERAKAEAVREPSAPAARKPVIDRSDKLYEQCLALETFLTKTLISGMRSTVQKTGLIDDSFAGKMYEDMLYDEYAKTYTENAKFGLADLAYLELTGQRGRLALSTG